MVTLPIGIGLIDWTDQVSLDLEKYTTARKLMDETKWQDWAVQFSAYGFLPGDQPPNPYGFDDWREWAERFCEAVNK